jgi:hypothetical protein
MRLSQFMCHPSLGEYIFLGFYTYGSVNDIATCMLFCHSESENGSTCLSLDTTLFNSDCHLWKMMAILGLCSLYTSCDGDFIPLTAALESHMFYGLESLH